MISKNTPRPQEWTIALDTRNRPCKVMAWHFIRLGCHGVRKLFQQERPIKSVNGYGAERHIML